MEEGGLIYTQGSGVPAGMLAEHERHSSDAVSEDDKACQKGWLWLGEQGNRNQEGEDE